MSFTHYPKTEYNLIMSWVYPGIKEEARKVRHGDSKNIVPVPSVNMLKKPLEAKGESIGHHSAQNFTRFYGSIFSDVPIQLLFDFANDDFTKDGKHPLDKDLPLLNYDANALIHAYDPEKPQMGSKFLVTIYGKWLRVTLRNTSDKPSEVLRVHVRGSVF